MSIHFFFLLPIYIFIILFNKRLINLGQENPPANQVKLIQNLTHKYKRLGSEIFDVLQILISFYNHIYKDIHREMHKASAIRSAYVRKDAVSKRKISFRQTATRWLALLLGCLVVFGAQYCFDNPSALQNQIVGNLATQHDGHKEYMEESEFNLLYALYSFPNVLIPLIGGILIDKLGARNIMMVTAFICIIGQLVFAFGGNYNLFWLMLVGRGLFGVGGQSLTASQNTLLSNWFKPSQLSFIIGICISFPKLGSATNSFFSPKIASQYSQYNNVFVPLLIGLGVMIVAFLFSLILAYLDAQSDRRERLHHETQLLSQAPSKIVPKQRKQKQPGSQEIKYGQVRIEETDERIAEDQQEQAGEGHTISLKDITDLPLSFWLLIVVSMLAEALFIPFLDNGNQYFHHVYDITTEKAGTYLILPYLFCAILCPFLGLVIDKVARRDLVIIFSCVMFVITYGCMMFLEQSPFSLQYQALVALPLALLGICCALFCTAIVPSVPMIVPQRLFGTAFGLMEMLQNLALAVFPLIAGTFSLIEQHIIQSKTWFYFVISVVCLTFSVALAIGDRLTGRKLTKKNFRKEYVKTVLNEEED